MACGSRPAFTPSTRASATATVLTWISMLLMSFMARPCPSRPMWNTLAPIARKRSWHAATVSDAPPTMIDSSPEAGPPGAPPPGPEARRPAGAAPLVPPAPRRVQHRDAGGRQPVGEPAGDERVDRAHRDDDVSGPRSVDDALLARGDRPGPRRGLA